MKSKSFTTYRVSLYFPTTISAVSFKAEVNQQQCTIKAIKKHCKSGQTCNEKLHCVKCITTTLKLQANDKATIIRMQCIDK